MMIFDGAYHRYSMIWDVTRTLAEMAGASYRTASQCTHILTSCFKDTAVFDQHSRHDKKHLVRSQRERDALNSIGLAIIASSAS